MIKKISKPDVIHACRETLGMPSVESAVVNDEFLTSLVRRSAGIHCPCSRVTLRNSLEEALQYLSDSEASLVERIEEIIEGLIVTGDLLELHDVSILDPSIKGTWVFAAPPSYVVREEGEIFVFGIVPDQDVFLPPSLASRIRMRGFTRSLIAEEGENLETRLGELGLQKLSVRSWLRSPKEETSKQLFDRFTSRLAERPAAGRVIDLDILDVERPVTFYRGRWTTCGRKTGIFVGRRPQEYGAPIWCLVKLIEGDVIRFLDLPANNSRWRGCDEAWHLQMAIDAEGGRPQLYRVHAGSAEWRLDFFSPLPAWAERRLVTFGRSVPREKCLMSYVLPSNAAIDEEKFLQGSLWLSRTEDSQ